MSRTPRPPAPLFRPERLVLPLSDAIRMAETGTELEAWLLDRQERGDPGPVFLENGVVWTEQSAAELATLIARGSRSDRVALSVWRAERATRAAGGIRPQGDSEPPPGGPVPPTAALPRGAARTRHVYQLATGHLIEVRRPPHSMGHEPGRGWFQVEWEIAVWFPIYYGAGRDGSIPLRCGESFWGNTWREAMGKLREASRRFGPDLGWAGVTMAEDGSLVMPEDRERATNPRRPPAYIGTGISHLPTAPEDEGGWSTPTDES